MFKQATKTFITFKCKTIITAKFVRTDTKSFNLVQQSMAKSENETFSAFLYHCTIRLILQHIKTLKFKWNIFFFA